MNVQLTKTLNTLRKNSLVKKNRKSQPNKSFTRHWVPTKENDFRFLIAKIQQQDPIIASLEIASIVTLLGTSSKK